MIFHIDNPKYPQFHFEWHPDNRRVYVIVLGSEPAIAEPIAEGVIDQRVAYAFVNAWCHGYGTRNAEIGVQNKRLLVN